MKKKETKTEKYLTEAKFSKFETRFEKHMRLVYERFEKSDKAQDALLALIAKQGEDARHDRQSIKELYHLHAGHGRQIGNLNDRVEVLETVAR